MRETDSDWGDRSWTPWIRLDYTRKESGIIPKTSGVYRIRVKDSDFLMYIGQTRDLKRRLGSLKRHTYSQSMPWNDPHTAAPNLWAWRNEEQWDYECSATTTIMSEPDRMALECYLLWQYRLEKGESTFCNHGRFHRDYFKPSNKTQGRAGRKLDLDEPRNPSWGLSHPPLEPVGTPDSPRWMNLSWSDFEPFPKGLHSIPQSAGVYRILSTDGEVEYIGESQKLRERFTTHTKIFSGDFYSYESVSQKMPKYQRLDLENDLLGHFYHIHKTAPKRQFRKRRPESNPHTPKH